MLSEKILKALNRQMNAESASAYLYMGMAAWLDARNLRGCAAWMKAQAHEEFRHAMKFYDFINSRNGRVIIKSVGSPKTEWDSPLAMFEDAYKHECGISALINELVDLAAAEKDHASHPFLQWFVTEQIEEESSADKIVQKLKLIGDHPMGLVMLDKELAARAFTPPASSNADAAVQ